MSEVKTSPTPESGQQSERRRSHRVNIAMPVIVRGKKANQPFEEETRTSSVNAHGCMVRIATPVVRMQPISLVNKKTAEELPCTVTYVGQKESGKWEVGLEFAEPSPLFWRIAFPPEDWDPSERKRSAGPRSAPPPLPRK